MTTSATSSTFPTRALQDALATSVADGTFADTAYYLYSQRLRSWKIGKPRAVYANSGVMKATASYFHNHFNEDTATDQRIEPETEDYGYESDSDIDDSEIEKEVTLQSQLDSDGDETADASDISIPSTPEPESPKMTKKLQLAGTEYKYRVVVPDVAASTWQALVHFIYTGTIHFAPLKSQGLAFRQAERTKHHEKNPCLPPLCSPKSVYRLANSVGLEELKTLARNDLKTKITKETITREVFSRFSSMHSEILNMELGILYMSSLLPDILPKVLEMISSIAQGDMPHSEKALAGLLTKLSTLLVPPPRPASQTIFGNSSKPGVDDQPRPLFGSQFSITKNAHLAFFENTSASNPASGDSSVGDHLSNLDRDLIDGSSSRPGNTSSTKKMETGEKARVVWRPGMRPRV